MRSTLDAGQCRTTKDRLQEFDPALPLKAKQLIIDAGGPGPPLVDHLRANLSRHVTTRGANTLKCDSSLDGWSLLKEELLERSGNDTKPVESSAHDDLAIATGLAAWAATNDFPELLSEAGDETVRRGLAGGSGPLF